LNLTRSLSIIIPAYNEESRLPDTLLRINNYLAQGKWLFVEILVVDDGSTDHTVQVAENYAQNGCPVRVIKNGGNRGKGYSVKHGMLEGKGEWLLLTDADLSTPIEELDKLWRAVENEPAEIAIGSRAIDRSLIGVHQPAFREKAGQLFNWTMRRVLRLNIRDTQCGFKLFSAAAAREIFPRQKLDRFGFDAEVLFIGRKLNCSILEIPVRWNNVEGSKVSLWNGASSFLDLMRVRLNDVRGIYHFEER
jgi:dolichyl-phosphate beta-glucosyltransferase